MVKLAPALIVRHVQPDVRLRTERLPSVRHFEVPHRGTLGFGG